MNVYIRVQDQQERRIRWMPFIAPEMTLGRELNNDLVLLRSTVAKRHCKIVYAERQFACQQLHRPMDGSAHDAPIQMPQLSPLSIQKPGREQSPAIQIAEFAIALEEHPLNNNQTLDQICYLLQETSQQTASQRLETALSLAPLPRHLLHHFAIDCAERSLLREECAGREPSAQCWEALRIKRRWIENKASERERNAAQLTVERQIFYCFEEEIFSASYATYAAAASTAAATGHNSIFAVESNATNWAADAAAAAATGKAMKHAHPSRQVLRNLWYDAHEKECEWQCQRLSQLIQHMQKVRKKAVSLLTQRLQRQTHQLRKIWQPSFEQALFI